MDPARALRQILLPMYTRRFEEFPLTATRDLLGLVRVLYLHQRDRDGTKAAKLRRIGEDLVLAVQLGSTCRPGTAGHQAAWARAERAAREVGECIEALDSAEPIIAGATARVVRALGRRRG